MQFVPKDVPCAPDEGISKGFCKQMLLSQYRHPRRTTSNKLNWLPASSETSTSLCVFLIETPILDGWIVFRLDRRYIENEEVIYLPMGSGATQHSYTLQ